MKKAILLCFVIVLTLACIVSCKKGKDNKDNSLAEMKSRKVFIIGLDDSFPPMGYRNENNEIVGFDVDLAKEVAKRIGVDFKAQPIDWNAKEMELKSGSIDCIWNGFTITDERKKNLLFSEPYLKNEQVILVKKNGSVKSETNLTGKKVGIQIGSSGAESYEKSGLNKMNNTVEFKNFLTAIMDLQKGGIDAIIIDSTVAQAQMKLAKAGNDLVIVKSNQMDAEEYGIGFRKNDYMLRNEVQRHIDDMKKDGTFQKIAEKYDILI